MKNYEPMSIYRESNRLNTLIEGFSQMMRRRLLGSVEAMISSKSILAAKGNRLDEIGNRIGILRPVLVDDTNTRYVVTDRLSANFKESQKGEIFFDNMAHRDKAGVVFFTKPVGSMMQSSDDIYRDFIRSYVLRSYHIYNHEMFLEVLGLFLGGKPVRVTTSGKHIDITVVGTLSPMEISYFSGRIIPVPNGRIIEKVQDDNAVIYTDSHYVASHT